MELLKKVDVSVENKVVGYLITSTQMLTEVRNILHPEHFESPMARIVTGWTVEFYDRTGEAPGKSIADVYIMKKDNINEADAQLVYAFLQNCSDNWKPTNFEYSKKIVIDYIQERSMKNLISKLNAKSGNVSECQSIIAEYIKPETYHSSSVDVLNDISVVAEAFSEEDEELFYIPGDLGKVTGNFCRGDFVSFLAPPKRGKTWWMMFLAMTAFLQGCKVLFISLEMTEKQMARRFWQFLSGCSRDGKPQDCAMFEPLSEDRWELVQAVYNTIQVDTRKEAISAIQEAIKQYSNGGRLILRRYDTNSLSLRDLKNELKNLEAFENFVPDVIVLDYADIMKMNSGKGDKRFEFDELWKGLRGLNLQTNTCLITASQSGRATVTGEKDADESDIAEAVSKINHVTKMITINQNKEDKKLGVYRLNCNTTRDGGVVFDTAVVTSCLSIGRPYMDCHLLSHVDMGRKKDEEPKFKRI